MTALQSSRAPGGSFSAQALAAGLLAAFVGVASSFAVIIQGVTAVGATQAQAASGLMALSISMGLCAIYLSLKLRQPISVAWSTPGAALLATTGPVAGGFSAAVGAFMICSLLIIISGLWRPLGRWVAAIPAAVANAMLAGILLGLCLAPVRAVAERPALGLTIVVTWALVGRLKRVYAVPAAVLVTIALIIATNDAQSVTLAAFWPQPEAVLPTISPAAVIGIALPLYIVTMASQNIPGLAILHVNGYRPDAGRLFTTTGLFSLLSAPFGGHAVNLAAITAALCAGAEAHPDPARRYWAAAFSGGVYILFGFMAAAATAFISASPPILIEAVAGLALMGALGAAFTGAMADSNNKEAAVVTFIVTASGLTFFGIGGAFWGLVAGGAMCALSRWRRS